MAHKETVLTWLKDAYAMEQGIAQALEKHADDARDYPEIQLRLNQHLETTRRHIELVGSCIERLGDSPSAIKSGLANIIGWFQGVSTSLAQDELVKNALADYAAEHFEIASYTSLVAAAMSVGDEETARVCEQILLDEEGMAQWFRTQIPLITQDFLIQKAAEHRDG